MARLRADGADARLMAVVQQRLEVARYLYIYSSQLDPVQLMILLPCTVLLQIKFVAAQLPVRLLLWYTKAKRFADDLQIQYNIRVVPYSISNILKIISQNFAPS